MSSVAFQRLRRHHLAAPHLRDAAALVSHFGAIQAQDFRGAKWAIGLRTRTLTDEAVERAFNDGAILRTHVLRPTWHFVSPDDVRWLIALTGPRVIARMTYRHRQLELDAETVSRSRRAMTRALEKGPLTRGEIAAVLEGARLAITAERLAHLIMHAELDGVICSGPLCGRQFTYALMEARAPRQPPLGRDEAIGRLAERYVASRGPASAADLAWWSGLSLREAKRAIEIAGNRPERAVRSPRPAAWLLPNFDEYLVAYTDRSAVHGIGAVDPRDTLAPTVILDGVAAGTWRTRLWKGSVTIDVSPRRRLSRDEWDRIDTAAGRYGRFIGRPVEIAKPRRG